MTAQQADTTLAPALKALGGWSEAPWFSASILSDHEVVGFQLPQLPGMRSQSFQITDRSAPENQLPDKVRAVPAKPPKTIAGKLSNLLDSLGVTNAAACSRSRFLFEAAPTLFFAEIPAAKLKSRPANKLRRDLIDIGIFGCVVSAEKQSITVMFWPKADAAIMEFVRTAQPEYPLHIDFFKAPTAGREPTSKAKSKAESRPRSSASEKSLLQEISSLRQQIEKLQQSQSAVGAMEKLGIDDARLKSMLTLLHPDKHGGSEAANEAAKWINNLRALLRSR
jgi:hypothetical protein